MAHVNLPISVDVLRLAEVCRHHHVCELAVFGSALRPDFRPESDVDLLVSFEPGARVGLLEFSRLRDELEQLFGRSVDLVPKGGLNRHIRDEVLASAIVLHAA